MATVSSFKREQIRYLYRPEANVKEWVMISQRQLPLSMKLSSTQGVLIYHFALFVESDGDPTSLRTQLKFDVILVFARFECDKIVTGAARCTVCGLRVTTLCLATLRS